MSSICTTNINTFLKYKGRDAARKTYNNNMIYNDINKKIIEITEIKEKINVINEKLINIDHEVLNDKIENITKQVSKLQEPTVDLKSPLNRMYILLLRIPFDIVVEHVNLSDRFGIDTTSFDLILKDLDIFEIFIWKLELLIDDLDYDEAIDYILRHSVNANLVMDKENMDEWKPLFQPKNKVAMFLSIMIKFGYEDENGEIISMRKPIGKYYNLMTL
jgi:hypothetical protein